MATALRQTRPAKGGGQWPGRVLWSLAQSVVGFLGSEYPIAILATGLLLKLPQTPAIAAASSCMEKRLNRTPRIQSCIALHCRIVLVSRRILVVCS